jgi:hypothetical protein
MISGELIHLHFSGDFHAVTPARRRRQRIEQVDLGRQPQAFYLDVDDETGAIRGLP